MRLSISAGDDAMLKYLSPRMLGRIAWGIAWMIGSTLRIERPENEIRGDEGTVIFALWHGRMFLPLFCRRNEGVHVLVSEHRDGEIVTATLESAGCHTVRGSTTRGGARALVRIVRLLREGTAVAFTPDGPRGPRWVLQPGVVYAAAKTGIPIVPLVGGAERAWVLRSWDRFQLPKPFSRCLYANGEPYYVTGGMDETNLEFHRGEIERRMNDLLRSVDERLGAGDS